MDAKKNMASKRGRNKAEGTMAGQDRAKHGKVRGVLHGACDASDRVTGKTRPGRTPERAPSRRGRRDHPSCSCKYRVSLSGKFTVIPSAPQR